MEPEAAFANEWERPAAFDFDPREISSIKVLNEGELYIILNNLNTEQIQSMCLDEGYFLYENSLSTLAPVLFVEPDEWITCLCNDKIQMIEALLQLHRLRAPIPFP